ncbi:MAG: hypothetical protein KJ718_06320 [Nanoarchaeota archaeon]|nr:hypothetical protein [Nanoarchaeota archaeon]MBU1052132.1 hypothetical protein [Nanoarchaeota archaeon]MBU1987862.1 hypothetical protein [Nanoarchaeota archaeon]
MVTLKDRVNDLPCKLVYKFLTPAGTKVSESVLKLENSGTERLRGESGNCVRYCGYRLRVGAYDDSREVWVKVEPIERGHLGSDKVNGLLSKPETFSRATKLRKNRYLNFVSKGKIGDVGPNGSLTVKYKVLRKKLEDVDEFFDAFWYVFKPMIIAMSGG